MRKSLSELMTDDMRPHHFCAMLMASTAINTTTVHANTVSQSTDTGFAQVILRDRPIDEIWNTAGAVDIRDHSDFEDNYADDVADIVFFSPQLRTNNIDLQEPRLSIRGFDLGGIAARSNVHLLRDGAPLTDVHGTTNSSEINPYTVGSVKTLAGVANIRDGGGDLGGVVELRTLTGRDVAPGLVARFDGGIDISGGPGGQLHARIANQNENFDYFVGVTGVYETGFRGNNERISQQLNANLGKDLGANARTQFYLDIVNSETELAGGLTLADLETDPNSPTPSITLGPLFPGGPIISLVDGASEDQFARDIQEGRLANKTNFRLLGHNINLGGHYTRRYVDSPQIDFIGVLDEGGSEWGAQLEIAGETPAFGDRVRYRAGANRTTGTTTQDVFENDAGVAGIQTASAERRSKILNAFVEGIYNPIRRLTVDVGAKFIRVNRQVTDLLDNNNDERSFTGVAARGGLRFSINERLQTYASVSRAYEPPTTEVLTAGDPANLNGLDEQDSFSLELGLRGSISDRLSFDIAFYETDVENEIVALSDPSSPADGDLFTNADNTRHRGAEVGADFKIIDNPNRQLVLRNVYTYADHRFTTGGGVGVSAGNRLGGVPTHHYRGELRFDSADNWYAAANVELTGGAFYVDHDNTTEAPTAAIVGFSGGYILNDKITIFASAENVLDQTYAAGVSPVLTFNPDDDRIFTPGARASVFGGIKYRF